MQTREAVLARAQQMAAPKRRQQFFQDAANMQDGAQQAAANAPAAL